MGIAELNTKQEQVKKTLATTTADSQQKMEALQNDTTKIHKLVNSAMGTQLRLYMLATERLAKSGEPVDVETARLAREAWRMHEAEQAKMDAGQ
jgi:hypothetical protein